VDPAVAVSLTGLTLGPLMPGTVRRTLRNASCPRAKSQLNAAVDATIAVIGGLSWIRLRWIRLPR
jgi:hypothetical protein